MSNAITEFNGILTEFIDRIENLIEKLAEDVDDGMEYARTSYWVLFGFACLLILLLFVLMLLACCHCQNSTSCASKRTCGRVFLVIIGFLSFVFCLLSFLILVGSVIMSGVCGFVREINQDQLHELYKFDGLDKKVIDLANLCLLSNSTGDLKDYIASTSSSSEHTK